MKMLISMIWTLMVFTFKSTFTNEVDDYHDYLLKESCNVCVANQDYCNPDWLPALNLNMALRGTDIAKKYPLPSGPDGDPSVRGIIFNAVKRDFDHGNMEPYTFYTYNPDIQCDSEFDTKAWTNLKQYIHGSSDSSMSNWDVGYNGPKITAKLEIPDIGSISMTPPPNSASYGQGKSHSNLDMAYFFTKECGSISRSSARCSIYTVDINIDEPSLSLHPGFISAIKDIDNAVTPSDKNIVMKKFIEKFGTHYTKESVMGIGVEFETRYTEKETLDHDDQTRNDCSSNSGGFSLFGFGSHHSKTECQGSLNNTTNGKSTRVDRFKSTTYGTLPVKSQSLTEWSDLVQKMLNAKTLTPIPTQQSLTPIVNILLTPAVAKIKHDDHDHTFINITNVIQTAVTGYLNYLTLLPPAPSFDWACANTVRMDTNVYHLQTFMINGRSVYKDEDESTSKSKYIFYSKNGFTVSTSFTSENEDILTSASCPLRGAVFDGSTTPFPSQNWQDCYKQCSHVSDCNYWQHNNNTKICSLFSDYERIESSSDFFAIGALDCPGNSFKCVCREKPFSVHVETQRH